jgi:predicted deacylase
MLRVGTLQARPGEQVFGYLDVGRTRSGLSPAIPIHLFAGAEPGPTLLVQGALHGTEIVGSIAILNVVNKLDPGRLRGNLIAVPVLNRVGFELNARISPLDHKDIGRLFPGNPQGSLSDRIAYIYFEEVIRQANVMIDFHQGGLASYERYVLFSAERDPVRPSSLELKRRKLVVAFGLPAVAFFPPGTFEENQSSAIEEAGVVQFTPELGGGTGWYKNGLEDVYVGERGIWNTLKAMRMIDGEFESDGPLCTVFNAGIVFWKPAVEGLFLRHKGMGEAVRAGEVYGSIIDPYTGRTLVQMHSPQDATVIPGGREWPSVGDTSVGILGVVERVEDRRIMDLYVSFD